MREREAKVVLVPFSVWGLVWRERGKAASGKEKIEMSMASEREAAIKPGFCSGKNLILFFLGEKNSSIYRGGGVKNIQFFLGFFWPFGRFSLIWRKG